MGQTQSKRDSTASSQPLSTTAADNLTTAISQNQSSHSIAYPAAPRTLTRLSELIDPYELLNAEITTTTSTSPVNSSEASQQAPSPTNSTKRVMIQSPSGNMLSASEFLERPDRKLTLAERKKAIEQRTRQKIETTEIKAGGPLKWVMEGRRGQAEEGSKAKGWLACFSCFK